MLLDHPILEAKLIVPAHLVPLNALEHFKATVKDSENQDFNLEFFSYNPTTNCYEFARGDLGLIYKLFGHLGIEDRRVAVPMESTSVSSHLGYGLKFTKTLRKGRQDQQEIVDLLLKGSGYGQIKAPPRFGKTVVMAYLTCHFGMKTLFLSHQIDLAKQALKTFYNFTNAIDLEFVMGKQIFGLVDDWDDLDKFDVAFMPYQKFVSGNNADEMLQKYRNRFGVVFVDESHKSTATEYSKIVGAFNPKVRQGVSGTTERKDDMHVVSNFVLGPVIAEGFTPQVPCKVTIIPTGVQLPSWLTKIKDHKVWRNHMQDFLAKHNGRNQLLLGNLAAWATAGHQCIAVTDRIGQIDWLVKELKAQGIAAEPFHRKAFGTGKKSAERREQCLERCRSGETRVLIAYRTMVLGLDIPKLSSFHNLMPTANPPNFYQEFCRVRTPTAGKDLAYIVDYADDNYLLNGYTSSRKKVYVEQQFDIQEIALPSNHIGDKGHGFSSVKV